MIPNRVYTVRSMKNNQFTLISGMPKKNDYRKPHTKVRVANVAQAIPRH